MEETSTHQESNRKSMVFMFSKALLLVFRISSNRNYNTKIKEERKVVKFRFRSELGSKHRMLQYQYALLSIVVERSSLNINIA